VRGENNLQHTARESTAAQCHVLIVDDDPVCLEEYAELLESLGYPCQQAPDAATALRMICNDYRIGIVLTDLLMPEMDGLTLLDELSNRFMATRPLLAIVVTGQTSLDIAISAMRSNAIDFLEKPVSLQSLSASLRRASARWTRLAAVFQLQALAQTTGGGASDFSQGRSPAAGAKPTIEELQNFASQMMKDRQIRSKFFDAQILNGPAWDILIDLAAAGLQGRAVPTSSACASTQAPFSTALRHVNQLVEANLVKRTVDPGDKRRTLLELEPEALEQMTRYLASSWEMHSVRRR
jgi:FixJ family two-component response regulator/DNA-binding MarR family transcriptional regulator